MAGEPMKKYFLILPLLFLLTSCGESNIPEIDTYTWEMTSVQSGEDNGKVISASVSIHTSICPECGRSYVSGGTTRTMIKYTDESNPYQKDLKAQDASVLRGANIDMIA